MTFEEAWAKMEAKGYRYGQDAIEQVRFGWELRDVEVDALREALKQAGDVGCICPACRWAFHSEIPIAEPSEAAAPVPQAPPQERSSEDEALGNLGLAGAVASGGCPQVGCERPMPHEHTIEGPAEAKP